MKQKGFTLIELLAVIVVLAIIAVIATPMVLNTIDDAKKGAAMASATTYINEVEKQVAVSKLDDKEPIIDGTYLVTELTDVKVKGNAPTSGQLTILNGTVVEARLYVDGYSIDYDGKVASESNNNYGGNDIILNINGEEIKKELASTVEFTNVEINLSMGTNIVCNNGAQIRLEDNKAIITDALGSATCKVNASLKDTVDNLDKTKNYIYMLSDETVSDSLKIEEQTNVTLNLNGKTLTYDTAGNYMFSVFGTMNIEGTNGFLQGAAHSIEALENSNLVINGGTYNQIKIYGKSDIKNSVHQCTENKNNCYPLWAYGNAISNYDNIQVVGSLGKAFGALNNSNVTIKNSKFECTLDNCIWFNSEGKLILNNVEINAYGYAVKNYNTNGTIEIVDSKIVAAVEESSSVAIEQSATGDKAAINIKNSTIESNHSSLAITGSGDVNIYNSVLHSLNTEGNDNVYISKNVTTDCYVNIVSSNIDSDGSHGVKNDGYANISIKDSNITGAASAVVNSLTGIVSIDGGTYTVDGVGYQGAISNRSTGIINICSGTVNGLENKFDLYNHSTGYIKYNSSVILKNNTIYDTNDPTHVVVDDLMSCK